MTVNLVAQRLIDGLLAVRKIGVAADLASIDKEALSFPAAFVVLQGERGADNFGMTGYRGQRRVQRIGIVLAVRNLRDAKGSAAAQDMDSLRGQVDDLLFGWQPGAGYEPLVFEQGNLVKMLNGEVWWMDGYTTAYQRRTT